MQESRGNNVQNLSDIVGNWGPWQLKILIGYTLFYLTNPFLNLGMVFFAPRIDFWCKTAGDVKNASTYRKCEPFDGTTSKCTEWLYDKSVFHSTAVDEFDLVCDRAWMISAASSVFQIGYALSSLFTGHISDRFGRLRTFKLCVFGEILCGLSQALSISMEHFLISRLLLGVFVFGKFFTGYTLIIEVVGVENRSQVSVIAEVGWSMGSMLLPLFAYFVPHFRYLQLCISCYSIVMLATLSFITESPRWLIANGRIPEAEAIMLEAARQKGQFSVEVTKQKVLALKMYAEETENFERGKQSLFDIWRVPSLLKYYVVLYVQFSVCILVFYSMVLNVGDLGGNIFWNSFFYSFAQMVTYILLYFSLPRVDRRKMYLSAMLVCGTAILATVPFISGSNASLVRLIFSIIGEFFNLIGFNLSYLQAAEIFPTTVRQSGIGSCSFVSRVGSIAAPFAKELDEAVHPAASEVTLGCLAVLAGILGLLLPETRGKEIPDTIAHVKATYFKEREKEPEQRCESVTLTTVKD